MFEIKTEAEAEADDFADLLCDEALDRSEVRICGCHCNCVGATS